MAVVGLFSRWSSKSRSLIRQYCHTREIAPTSRDPAAGIHLQHGLLLLSGRKGDARTAPSESDRPTFATRLSSYRLDALIYGCSKRHRIRNFTVHCPQRSILIPLFSFLPRQFSALSGAVSSCDLFMHAVHLGDVSDSQQQQ